MKAKDLNQRERTILRDFVNHIIQWCIDTYGYSKYNPKNLTFLLLYKKPKFDKEDRFQAYYKISNNEIVLCMYELFKLDLNNLIVTVIHEYIHYLQPGSDLFFEQMAEYFGGYNNNPLEIDAETKAVQAFQLCKKHLKDTFLRYSEVESYLD